MLRQKWATTNNRPCGGNEGREMIEQHAIDATIETAMQTMLINGHKTFDARIWKSTKGKSQHLSFNFDRRALAGDVEHVGGFIRECVAVIAS